MEDQTIIELYWARERTRAQKRGGGQVSLVLEELEDVYHELSDRDGLEII